MTQKVLPAVGSVAADTIGFAYDLGGRVTQLSDTLGNVLTPGFDTAGRVIANATTVPGLSGALTASYQLDANSNRKVLAWPDGYSVTYTYDSLNRMTMAADSNIVTLAQYQYDPWSRRTGLTYANNASAAYTYSAAGDLLTLTNTLNGAAANNTYAIGYTNAHQLASEGPSNTAYEYQMQSSAAGTDAYAAVNVLNQYPSITAAGSSAANLTYDGDGNLTFDGTWTYAYDSENKLMTASNGSTVSAAYAYDPLGRRTEKSGTGVTTTVFLNDGTDEIAEYGANGTVLRRFVPGPAINEPIAYENCANATAPNCTGSGLATEYFHSDHHGSVAALSVANAAPATDEGTLPWTYDPCGVGAPLTGEPFKYVGMYLDAETGLYYDRARYYSASTCRFLQTDPIGYEDDLDMYAYVTNDPLNATDPTGLTTYYLELGGTLVGGMGGKAGGGIFFTTQNNYGMWDVGTFTNAGVAVGANIGAGGVVGYVNGPLANFQGRFINFDVSVLAGQGSASFSPAGANTFSNGPVGYAVGLAASPTVGGVDMSVTWTKATGLFQDYVMPNLPFDTSSFSNSSASTSQGVPTSVPSSSSLGSVNWGNTDNTNSVGTLNLGGTSTSSTPPPK